VLTEEAVTRVRGAASCLAVTDYNGDALALLGCSLPDSDGFAHVWAGFTDEARGHGVRVFRLTRRLLDEMMRQFQIECCYTWTHADALENDKWMRLLGFVRHAELDVTENSAPLKGYVYGLGQAGIARH
jgi:hypothetical protein